MEFIWSNYCDLTRVLGPQKAAKEGKSSLFQRNLGWWNVIPFGQILPLPGGVPWQVPQSPITELVEQEQTEAAPEFFERTRDEGWSGRNKNIDRLVLIHQIKFSTMPQSLSIFDFYTGILVFIVQASNTCPVMDSDTSNLAINLQYLHLDLCPNFQKVLYEMTCVGVWD